MAPAFLTGLLVGIGKVRTDISFRPPLRLDCAAASRA
jgi:hypothetical protein